MISVAVIKPDEALTLPWGDLGPFAHNAFMNPVALKAATDTMLAVIYILVAWDMSVEPARLVGFWALQAKHLVFWPFLEALPFNYAFLSTPVMHPDYADDVMPAFLAAVARDRTLPRPSSCAISTAPGANIRRSSRSSNAIRRRPATGGAADRHPGGRHQAVGLDAQEAAPGLEPAGRRRQRRDRERPRSARIGEAFETFLALEAGELEGNGGDGAAQQPQDAAFARRLVADLAARGEASVRAAQLGGRSPPRSCSCGRAAYTWKTSFDAAFARFSPARSSSTASRPTCSTIGAADLVDSCARSDGFMGQLLAGRKPVVDLVLRRRRASPPLSSPLPPTSGP